MLEFDNGSIAVPECLVSRLDFDLACFWKCCDSLVKRPRKLPGLDTVDGSIKQVFLCRFASVVNCVCQHILTPKLPPEFFEKPGFFSGFFTGCCGKRNIFSSFSS